jgi:hypothetical protein
VDTVLDRRIRRIEGILVDFHASGAGLPGLSTQPPRTLQKCRRMAQNNRAWIYG